MLEQFKEAKKKANEAIAAAKELVKDAFKEASSFFFAQYPNVESITWRAYTPSFNDGDPCYFSSTHPYPFMLFVGQNIDELDDTWEGYEDEGDSEEVKTQKKEAYKQWCSLIGTFDNDDMENMFGDGVEVTLTKDGTITKDNYDCGH